jgi:Protein of unknown function (DUF2934)
VDIETRRQKQQQLMVRIVERKVRKRAQQLYDERGQGDGNALKDWFQAEDEIVENTVVGPLYRRLKSAGQPPHEDPADAAQDASTRQSNA